jgi:Icc-related predicted phosphoesterase
MRIAYVVDVHDRFDMVPRVVEQIGAVDVLVVGGDITTGGTPDDAEHAIELWRPLAPTLLAVAGNMDSPAIDDRLVALGVSLGRAAVRAPNAARASGRGARTPRGQRARRRSGRTVPSLLPTRAAARDRL